MAREAAAGFPKHGFDKASGAWWGVESGMIHRITVAPKRKRPVGLALGLGAAGIDSVVVASRIFGRDRKT